MYLLTRCAALYQFFYPLVVYEQVSQQLEKEIGDFWGPWSIVWGQPKRWFFVDEGNKDRKAARRKYGWAPVVTRMYYCATFNLQISYTFIGLASYFGFLIPPGRGVVLHQLIGKQEYSLLIPRSLWSLCERSMSQYWVIILNENPTALSSWIVFLFILIVEFSSWLMMPVLSLTFQCCTVLIWSPSSTCFISGRHI